MKVTKTVKIKTTMIFELDEDEMIWIKEMVKNPRLYAEHETKENKEERCVLYSLINQETSA